MLEVTHGFPHPGQFGGQGDARCDRCRRLIEAVSLPITGAMFWISPHARLLALVVGSAVALALLAVSPARRASRVHGGATPTVTAPDATPGSRAHERQVYRLGVQRSKLQSDSAR